jgi:hypothetical protein
MQCEGSVWFAYYGNKKIVLVAVLPWILERKESGEKMARPLSDITTSFIIIDRQTNYDIR